jgi:D-glycero-alpha-D-manno-heptose-7-phosphate kinase
MTHQHGIGQEARQDPVRVINSAAPIRICDNGGWTDTWFAEYGKIFNIAVYPHAEVQIDVQHRDAQEQQIIIYAENYGERYAPQHIASTWDRHPLLEAAIERMAVPDDVSIHITIFSEAPAGASTGTSAAVTVALIGALDLLTPGRLTPHQIAYLAQSVETDMLRQQCGIQDQLCSAYGGINFIEMHQYPRASVSQIQVPNGTWWELERRLALVYLGQSHASSQVHEKVIHALEKAGPTAKQLEALRSTAEPSRDALYVGDFAALGRAMIRNTEAQRDLHPDLVSADAQRVIDIAQAHSASGWKVNGAGGEGGSLTILCAASSHVKRAMLREIEAENPLFKNIPIHLSRFGLRVWETQVI